MNIFKCFLAIFTFFSAVFFSGHAEAQVSTQCDVFVQGEGTYTGACWFKASKNGSFEITLSDGHEAQQLQNLTSFEYSMTGPNKGTVIAMYNEGGEEWGTFTAMGRQLIDGQPKTCWQGKGKRLCIYR